ncbi:uncharacterized protein ATC70_002707 [Mucor velutinosus]|uniref:Uncharacterized protein n=1 Tax=Mucor velutinosus TaxID=708070 RepID=A0AAN7DDS3_9FUNG|nr:hypothetical protein ATC70_002707 [Mucor velutinosus]
MSSGQEEDSLINDELFHLYIEYQLCKIKNTPSLWNADDTEKYALISILTQCQKINGNTLRSVMKDIFENSVAKYADSSSSTMIVHHSTPHMNSSKNRIPQVIVNTTEDDDDDDETDSEASKEATTSLGCNRTRIIDRMYIDLDNAAVSKRNILPSNTPRRGRSLTPSKLEPKEKKQKHKGKAVVNPIVHSLLTDSKIAEMEQMASQAGRTKALLRKRIYAINDSVSMNVSSKIPATFSVLNYGNCPGTTMKNMYRCQENFIVYRFGKLVERLHQECSEREARDKAKEYYKELQHELKRQNKTYSMVPWSHFAYSCKKSVQYANEFGIYCLFIPEILTPTMLKRTPFEDLRALLLYMDESCSIFRNIVQVDCEGNIIAPHRQKSSQGLMTNKADISGSVLQH